MKKPLYRALASLMGAYDRCVETGNKEWRDKHEERIQALVNAHMPAGSGFDSGTKIDLDESSDERLVFYTSFHHMNDNGMYDGWTEHTVIVKPSLASGFTLRITGRDRREIKDYMYEVFDQTLHEEVEEYEQPAATDNAVDSEVARICTDTDKVDEIVKLIEETNLTIDDVDRIEQAAKAHLP
jgi:hypothetical protein